VYDAYGWDEALVVEEEWREDLLWEDLEDIAISSSPDYDNEEERDETADDSSLCLLLLSMS
jgi:predicted nicotinamide N-methyase